MNKLSFQSIARFLGVDYSPRAGVSNAGPGVLSWQAFVPAHLIQLRLVGRYWAGTKACTTWGWIWWIFHSLPSYLLFHEEVALVPALKLSVLCLLYVENMDSCLS